MWCICIKELTKKWSSDASYNTDGLQKHDAKWKKQDMKDYMLYDFIYIQCSEKAGLERQNIGQGLSGAGREYGWSD